MTGRTGYTALSNASGFAPPADMDAIYEHFDALIDPSVATASALPATGNWLGREIYAEDTGATWKYTATGWQIFSLPPTAWTPTINNVVASAVVAKYSMRAKTVTASVKITIASAPTGQPVISLPVNADTSVSSILGGGVMKNGTSAWVDTFVQLASASTVAMLPKFASIGSPTYTITGPSATVDATHPFAWAAGHTIEVTFTYLAA